MELPKNITQIGEVGRDCKVYVEDYVISYMKQQNREAADKEVAVALYGRRREENGVIYFFLYGACRLDSLQKEVRHLSQAQLQEIERLRRKHFPEYLFLGYRLLDGEMIEGFHIYEQEICRYISGYAQFYEKNDSMLAYMVDMRKEAEPEQVDQEKYEEVKKRQEERRAAAEKQARGYRVERRSPDREMGKILHMPASGSLQKMRMAAIGVFALLCLLGISTLREDAGGKKGEELQASAKPWVDETMQQLPDKTGAASESAAVKDTLVMEDKLDQVLLEENQAAGNASQESSSDQQAPSQTAPSAETNPLEEGEQQPSQEPAVPATVPETELAIVPVVSEQTAEPVKTSGTVAYVIRTGDTLIGISKRQYGNDKRVEEICSLNKISDPDKIKEGQVIMLPR